jgi:hypothetical protein
MPDADCDHCGLQTEDESLRDVRPQSPDYKGTFFLPVQSYSPV